MGWLDKFKKETPNDQEKAEMDAFIEKIGVSFDAKLDAKLKPITDDVAGIKTKWETLEKDSTTQLTEEEERARREREAGMTDEEKRSLNEKKLLAVTILTNARLTESEILGEVSAQGFAEFLPKIREHLTATDISVKGQANYGNYVRNVVDMVIGAAARNGGLKFDGSGKKFFLEDAAASGTNETTVLGRDLNWTDRNGKVVSGAEQLARLGINQKDFVESNKNGVV